MRLPFHCFPPQMTFEQDPSSPNDEWYMSGFKYRNLSIPVIFQYSGVEHAVTASGDMAYRCGKFWLRQSCVVWQEMILVPAL